MVWIMAVALCVFVSCRTHSDPLDRWTTSAQKTSVQMSAFAAENVYIAKVLSVSDDVRTVYYNEEKGIVNYEMLSFTAQVNRVFKGDYKPGETVADELCEMYRDFIKPGNTYAFCTGTSIDTTEDLLVSDNFIYRRVSTPRNEGLDVVCDICPDKNISAAVLINKDNSLSFFSDNVLWKPHNADELYYQLYDVNSFYLKLKNTMKQNITDVRFVDISAEEFNKTIRSEDGIDQLKANLSASENVTVLDLMDILTAAVDQATLIEQNKIYSFAEMKNCLIKAIEKTRPWIHWCDGVLNDDPPSEITQAENDMGAFFPVKEIRCFLVYIDGEPATMFAYGYHEFLNKPGRYDSYADLGLYDLDGSGEWMNLYNKDNVSFREDDISEYLINFYDGNDYVMDTDSKPYTITEIIPCE